jgi:ribosome-associated toxin RatA of RatAB toxin-antitoxin module
MKASLLVAKAGIKQWFTTQNTLVKNRSITLLLLDGPFKSLEGTWQFIPLDASACKIEFDLRFEFDNKLAKMAFGKIFTSLTSNMVNAFTRRAREVYQ